MSDAATPRFDLIVIGGGPAGEKGAAQAAYFGKKVAVIEAQREPGGAAVNTGTIPSKTLRETALYFSGFKQRGLYGIDYNLKSGVSVRDFLFRLQRVQENEWQLIRQNLFRHRIELFAGRARVLSPNRVRVETAAGGSLEIEGDVILVATGSVPHRPAHIPFDDVNIFDSDTILGMDHIPRSLAIVGGGVIGVEYACIFAAMEIEVTLIDGRDRLIPFLDREIGDLLLRRMAGMGVRFLFGQDVTAIAVTGGDVSITLKSGDAVTADSVLFAAGRDGATRNLGLEDIGVAVNRRGQVEVDAQYRTAVPNIFAVGDVIGFPALASTSMEQGRLAMCHAFGFSYKEKLAVVLPYGIYTIPEVSMCGETEQSCQEKSLPYLVGRASYGTNARGQIVGDLEGMLKLLFDPESKRLLGVHVLGESATELVHVGMTCLNHGDTIDSFIHAVYNFPTLTELYKYAAYDGLGNLARRGAVPPPPGA